MGFSAKTVPRFAKIGDRVPCKYLLRLNNDDLRTRSIILNYYSYVVFHSRVVLPTPDRASGLYTYSVRNGESTETACSLQLAASSVQCSSTSDRNRGITEADSHGGSRIWNHGTIAILRYRPEQIVLRLIRLPGEPC